MRTRRMGAFLLLIVMGVVALVAAPAASAEPRCANGWRFTELRKKRLKLNVVDRLRAENPTNSTQTVTFTSKKSKTITGSLSASIEGGYDAIFASVKVKIDAKVEKSVSAETGLAIKAKVPPHSYVIGRYGVFMRPVTGRVTRGDRGNNCLHDKRHRVILPSGQAGWRVSKYKLK